ncbi:MAG: hypothetical protein LBT71_07485 [Azoarcus sp.]|jgi:hypothetical protein|nr:hypothetical protein [Azoarcus sp.]
MNTIPPRLDATSNAAAASAPPPTLLGSSLGARLSIAIAASALLWLVIAWALT